MITKAKPENLPQILRSLRRAAGLSLMAAAQKVGFSSPSTIGHYETGKRKVPLHKLSKIAHAYGYDVEDVFHRPNAPEERICMYLRRAIREEGERR